MIIHMQAKQLARFLGVMPVLWGSFMLDHRAHTGMEGIYTKGSQ